MNREEEIPVPVWFLKHIEDTLRIENNINNDKKTGETCQDRNIKQALNGVRKILNGEALTGHERLEPLMPYSAKKDLALTWEDIRTITKILEEMTGEDILIEFYNDDIISCYKEVLRRFKEAKNDRQGDTSI